MSCWTLWQRMPPRYQLTMRDIRNDDQDTSPTTGPDSRASSATPRTPSLRTPRGGQRMGGSREKDPVEGAMLTSGVLPEDYLSDVELGPQNPMLPPRSSPYIYNMKNQMKINSAKRKIDEGTAVVTSPTTLSYTPKPRATTAPAFPITNPFNTDEYHRLTRPVQPPQASSTDHKGLSITPSSQPLHRPPGAFSGKKSPARPSSDDKGGDQGTETRHVPVRIISPFGEMPELRAKSQSPVFHHRASPTQQDCVTGGDQVAALQIDKGRVMFFRKTKPDVTQSVYSAMSPYKVTREDGSYLSHLRKAYLSRVRDLPKMTPREPDLEKQTTIRKRMDYDRKVGRILDYYTKVEFPKEMQSPRLPEVQPSKHGSPSPSPVPQQAFRTIRSRKRAPGVGSELTGSHPSLFNKGSEFAASEASDDLMKSHTPGQVQLPVCDRGGFVKINAQARLHNRHHFYLRTPAFQSSLQSRGLQQASGCACGMCRLEMEVALMAQLHRDLGVSVDAVTAAQIRSSLEESDVITDPNYKAETGVGAVAEGDTCPARPNSVPDSQLSAVSPELPVSVNRGDPCTAPSQHAHSGQGTNTCRQTSLVAETTSLTIILPVIEETNEITHDLQESETAESNISNNTEAAEKIEQTAKDSERESPDTITAKDSTPAEEFVSVYEDKQEPENKATEDTDNEPHSNTEKNTTELSDSNGCGSAVSQDHPVPAGDVRENVSDTSDSAETHPLQDTSAACDNEDTVTQSNPDTLIEIEEFENPQSVEVEKHISIPDFPSENV